MVVSTGLLLFDNHIATKRSSLQDFLLFDNYIAVKGSSLQDLYYLTIILLPNGRPYRTFII